MCYGGICSLNVDDMCDLFESLAYNQCDSASECFVCLSLLPYGLHAQSPCVDQFRDAYHRHFSYSHVIYSYCQCFDHDMNSCPYYDGFDECYTRLNAMMEIMNEKHECFVSRIRECSLLHMTNPSLSSLILKVSLCGYHQSSLLVESNIVMNTPLTNLKEAIDPL